MSLAHHVTQSEGFDYDAPTERDDDTISVAPSDIDVAHRTGYRRLSFDALAPPQFLHDGLPVDHAHEKEQQRLAAYKISDTKRLVQVITGIIVCLFSSGIVFGFAALKPVLIAEGVYSEFCSADEQAFLLEAAGAAASGNDGAVAKEPCAEQDIRLNLFFVVASITTNVSSLFAGTALDRLGRRFCWTTGALFIAVGCVLLGYSFKLPEFDAYLVGNFFLGLGGSFVFVSTYQLANAFPQHSGVIVALVTGAFDASAAVFLFYHLAYDASHGALSLQRFFFAYTLVPALILLAEWSYMPAHAYHNARELEEKIAVAEDVTQDLHSSDDEISGPELTRVRSRRAERRRAQLDAIEDLAGDAEQREERDKIREGRLETSGVWGVMHGVPAHRQMLTPWFIFILLLTVQQMLRMNQVIATIRSQYRFMLGSEAAAEQINQFFDVALPVGGIASTPFIAVFLNNVSVATSFGVLTLLILLISLFNCVPLMATGYVTIILFVIFRPLYYSAISDYATKVFGFATFGRIYGALVCISGFVNFAQSGLDAWVHGPLKGDPTPVNILMGVSGTVIGGSLTIFLVWQGRVINEIKYHDEEEEPVERMPLIQEEEENYGTTANGRS